METTPTVIDETALRRPDFQEGRRITLADGQEWTFPLPRIRFVPARLASGRIGLNVASRFGPEFDQLLDDFQAAETVADQVAALFALAVDLLDRNYDLTDEQYGQLLRYDVDPDAPNEAFGEIWRVAAGQGPKRSTAGSGSA